MYENLFKSSSHHYFICLHLLVYFSISWNPIPCKIYDARFIHTDWLFLYLLTPPRLPGITYPSEFTILNFITASDWLRLKETQLNTTCIIQVALWSSAGTIMNSSKRQDELWSCRDSHGAGSVAVEWRFSQASNQISWVSSHPILFLSLLYEGGSG